MCQEKGCKCGTCRANKHRFKLQKENPIRYTARQMCASAHKRAKRKGLEYDLDSAFVEDLCVDICPILGRTLEYGGGDKSDNSPSLDRIDSSKGYTKDNVWVISLLANLMKSSASEKDMLLFARWVLTEQ